MSWGEFFMMFHYPNQILRPLMFNKYQWPTPRPRNGSSYQMKFTVENVEIFKRRKKCKDWINYDEKVMDIFIQKVGCSPPYYLPRNDVPVCNTTKTIKEMASNIVLDKDQGIEPPCKSLEFMTFRYFEGIHTNDTGDFWLIIHVPSLNFKASYSN